MKCPKCGFVNKPDAKFCTSCRQVKFVSVGPARPAMPGAKPPPPKKHLLVPVGGAPIELAPDKPFTFGRLPTCSLPIPSPRVSRVHAEIVWQEGKPVIRDKGSQNGIQVGGQQMKERALEPGDEIVIGPFTCVYQFGSPADSLAVAIDTATKAEGGDLFTGQIGDAGLAEVLQSLEFNGKTGTLKVFTREEDGWLTVQAGALLAAEAGDRKDEEAVLFLLGLKTGRYAFGPDLTSSEKRIRNTVTGILLEFGRRQDEASAKAAELGGEPPSS